MTEIPDGESNGSIRLTELSSGGGCACKLGMSELFAILPMLESAEGLVSDPNIIVDAATRDDAAVYRMDDDQALVVTTDFFTPIVDDPFDFGRISATNAMSDVYAMGARPLFALNLVAFPRKYLNDGILPKILEGGAIMAREAGIPVMGGHSVDDPEPKFGMVVVGAVHPNKVVSNAGASVGDRLVLTKPLGVGIIANAIKKQGAPPALRDRAVELMTTLNRDACQAMVEIGVSAATDVTGFGLLGHLRNMLRASKTSAELTFDQIPLIDGVRHLAGSGFMPGGTRRNLQDVGEDVTFGAEIPEDDRLLLADAQTSGGLLIAVSPDKADRLVERLEDIGTPAAQVIGEIVEGGPGSISVR